MEMDSAWHQVLPSRPFGQITDPFRGTQYEFDDTVYKSHIEEGVSVMTFKCLTFLFINL